MARPGRKRQLSLDLDLRIVALREEGLSYRAIAAKLNVSRPSVYRLYRNYLRTLAEAP
ncbi:MAG: helix-turn-helix domain-containing protein [Steroidobacteraceae bacterium]